MAKDIFFSLFFFSFLKRNSPSCEISPRKKKRKKKKKRTNLGPNTWLRIRDQCRSAACGVHGVPAYSHVALLFGFQLLVFVSVCWQPCNFRCCCTAATTASAGAKELRLSFFSLSLSLSLSSPPPPVVVVRVHHWSVALLFLSVMRLFPLSQQVGGGGEREREREKESGTIHHQILGSVSRLRTLTGLFS